MASGYNKGDAYEEKIHKICIERGITPIQFKRGGAGNSSDIEFIHKGKINILEVKVDTKADYGQKMLKWNNDISSWCVDDEVTKMYTQLGILRLIQDRQIIPRRYTITKKLLTAKDRNVDQQIFELKIDIETTRLFLFYSQKNCHYIQIGGCGFYYLDKDVLNLNVPQFNGKLKMRFRAKTIHSYPIWNYGFYAVLKVDHPPTPSKYDIEEIDGKIIPPIHI